MTTKKVHTIYFSPAHSTREVVKAVAKGIVEEATHHDMTKGVDTSIEFSENDLVIIGVPSYSGRVPTLATEYLSKIKGKNTPVILVCVYGNREYEDTLLELKGICSKNGFYAITAGAFIARHTIFPNVAEGRPDKNDIEAAYDFGKKSATFADKKEVNLAVKGNAPYRAIKSIPLKPRVNANCNRCGACVTQCPVGAIDKENPRKTNKKRCISCGGCIETCPREARHFSGILYKIVKKNFSKKFSIRKENELFFP